MLILPLKNDELTDVLPRVLPQMGEGMLSRVCVVAEKLRRHRHIDMVVATEKGSVVGLCSMQYLLHTTRGIIVNVNEPIVVENGSTKMAETSLKMLSMMISIAETRGACRMDLTLSRHIEAALRAGFSHVNTSTLKRVSDKIPDITSDDPWFDQVNQMVVDQYSHNIRDQLLPQVSGGSYRCNPQQLREAMSSGLFHPFVVERKCGGKLVAYAELHHIFDVRFGFIGRIERVVTDADARREGASSALTRRLLEQAEFLKTSFVLLTVEKDNARRIYSRQGFIETDLKLLRLDLP